MYLKSTKVIFYWLNIFKSVLFFIKKGKAKITNCNRLSWE